MPEDPRIAGKLALERLSARAEMRSAHEIEDSVVIQQRAEERLQASMAPKSTSTPPTGPTAWIVQPVITIAKVVPGPQRIYVLLLLASLAVFWGIGKARGWW